MSCRGESGGLCSCGRRVLLGVLRGHLLAEEARPHAGPHLLQRAHQQRRSKGGFCSAAGRAHGRVCVSCPGAALMMLRKRRTPQPLLGSQVTRARPLGGSGLRALHTCCRIRLCSVHCSPSGSRSLAQPQSAVWSVSAGLPRAAQASFPSPSLLLFLHCCPVGSLEVALNWALPAPSPPAVQLPRPQPCPTSLPLCRSLSGKAAPTRSDGHSSCRAPGDLGPSLRWALPGSGLPGGG